VAQWCVEEAVFWALELSDSRPRGGGLPGGAEPEPSPHAALGDAHAQLIARARTGR
jgi:hypothetical protein